MCRAEPHTGENVRPKRNVTLRTSVFVRQLLNRHGEIVRPQKDESTIKVGLYQEVGKAQEITENRPEDGDASSRHIPRARIGEKEHF
jgi:hypothetical protein